MKLVSYSITYGLGLEQRQFLEKYQHNTMVKQIIIRHIEIRLLMIFFNSFESHQGAVTPDNTKCSFADSAKINFEYQWIKYPNITFVTDLLLETKWVRIKGV